jgi:hypothetical protein
MPKPNQSSAVFNPPSNLGFDAHVFNNDDVVRLLKAAIKSEGDQTEFARHHRINRSYVNMVLKVKDPSAIPLHGLLACARFTSPNNLGVHARHACLRFAPSSGLAALAIWIIAIRAGFEGESELLQEAKLLSKDEARRIAVNIAKLPELVRK